MTIVRRMNSSLEFSARHVELPAETPAAIKATDPVGDLGDEGEEPTPEQDVVGDCRVRRDLERSIASGSTRFQSPEGRLPDEAGGHKAQAEGRETQGGRHSGQLLPLEQGLDEVRRIHRSGSADSTDGKLESELGEQKRNLLEVGPEDWSPTAGSSRNPAAPRSSENCRMPDFRGRETRRRSARRDG